MPTSGVPIAAMSSNIFIVFSDEAALSMVMLFCASLVAYNKFGKTSSATVASRVAIVIEELKKASLNFDLFNNLGIFATARNMSSGKMK